MDDKTIGKLSFGWQRLRSGLDYFRASGAQLDAGAWQALLAAVAAVDLALAGRQRRPADAEPAQVKTALARCLGASGALKARPC